jgi:hypothetical protein
MSGAYLCVAKFIKSVAGLLLVILDEQNLLHSSSSFKLLIFMQKRLSVFLLTTVILLSCIAVVQCASQTFNAPVGRTPITVNFNQGDVVTGSMTSTGGLIGINFNITDPSGATVASYSDVSQTTFSFTASTSGMYTFDFYNSGLVPRSVVLDYSVAAPVLGVSQGSFVYIGVIIAVVAVVIVVVLVLMRKKKNALPPPPPQTA